MCGNDLIDYIQSMPDKKFLFFQSSVEEANKYVDMIDRIYSKLNIISWINMLWFCTATYLFSVLSVIASDNSSTNKTSLGTNNSSRTCRLEWCILRREVVPCQRLGRRKNKAVFEWHCLCETKLKQRFYLHLREVWHKFHHSSLLRQMNQRV